MGPMTIVRERVRRDTTEADLDKRRAARGLEVELVDLYYRVKGTSKNRVPPHFLRWAIGAIREPDDVFDLVSGYVRTAGGTSRFVRLEEGGQKGFAVEELAADPSTPWYKYLPEDVRDLARERVGSQ